MGTPKRSSPPPEVAEVFEQYPARARKRLLEIRRLVLSAASGHTVVGQLTETLKWGEPAYLTEQSRTGSTLRLGWKASAPDEVVMYFNCQTSIVDTIRTRFPELRTGGNRSVHFDIDAPLPTNEVVQCIEMALLYHRRKRGASRG